MPHFHFAKVITFLSVFAANLSAATTASRRIHLIMMMAGSRNPRMTYEIMGSAYDVALNHSLQLYPQLFRNHSVTRYFTSGTFTCAEANAVTTVGLSSLYTGDSSSAEGDSKGIRIVLTPEENVLVLASSASLNLLNNKTRFPTLLPLASTSYNNVGLALLKILRLNKWNAVNLVCDSNPSELLRSAIELTCGVLRETFKNARDINMLELAFDSSKNESTGAMLRLSRTHSSVSLFAVLHEIYKTILAVAYALEMANGDYVPESLLRILPFSFVLAFEAIKWDAVAEEVEQMRIRSRQEYNWTISEEYKHNAVQLAAYESLLMLAEVLNDTSPSRLANATGATLAARFFNRTFDLPARRVSLNSIGTRECSVLVKQFNNGTRTFQVQVAVNLILLRFLIQISKNL
ncbi:hypothetical protein BV898_12050 [Hypsibius exemplaris]|uniref:Receptor ligand binding region domain-containing protein n=1 Tax=Hypsibius exemplaris TaxID=2072580 RepID=A0A1W0WEU9_HYPEX|nr:hypothetical protein BV898_12050 [Hypsibius exemplaris]